MVIFHSYVSLPAGQTMWDVPATPPGLAIPHHLGGRISPRHAKATEETWGKHEELLRNHQ
jgi:hypothetical protein